MNDQLGCLIVGSFARPGGGVFSGNQMVPLMSPFNGSRCCDSEGALSRLSVSDKLTVSRAGASLHQNAWRLSPIEPYDSFIDQFASFLPIRQICRHHHASALERVARYTQPHCEAPGYYSAVGGRSTACNPTSTPQPLSYPSRSASWMWVTVRQTRLCSLPVCRYGIIEIIMSRIVLS